MADRFNPLFKHLKLLEEIGFFDVVGAFEKAGEERH